VGNLAGGGTASSGSNFKIKVRQASLAPKDFSDAPFSITQLTFRPPPVIGVPARPRPTPIVKAIPTKSLSLSMVEGESGTILKTLVDDSTIYYGDYMPSAGDAGSEHGCFHAFMSFDISQLHSLLPSGSTITKARLFIDKRRITRNPFYKLGNFYVINIEYSNLHHNKQENYNKVGFLLYNKKGLNREIDIAGIDVTTRFKSLLDGRHTRFQVRLQFSVENNGDRKSDRIHFAKGAEGCVLKVYYHE
jgi:hypothetical protein